MQGLVTLDFGNTNPHAGIFLKQAEWKLQSVVPFRVLDLELKNLGLTPGNTSLVLSEVKSREEELQHFINEGYLLTRLKDYWRGGRFAGMPVNYAHSLGEDRLICAYYAYKKYKTNCLLIDAGTFVTMDIVTEAGFQGGYIIPGVGRYFETYQGGDQLKAVALNESFSTDLPHTTPEAMRDSYGAFAALAHKLVVEANISKILVTGGHGPQWVSLLNNVRLSSSVQLQPELIHSSLHYWMTTQIEPL